MQLHIPDPVSVNDYIPTSYNILIYGPSGTGKTEFVATWAEAGEVLYLDSDSGILSIKSSPRIPADWKLRIKHVPIIDRSSDPHISQPIGWETTKAVIESVAATGKFGTCTPKTIAVDSATTISTMVMTYVLASNRKAIDAQPSLPDWGKQIEEMKRIINLARSLKGVNFIWVAHEQYNKDELSGRVWCLPLVTGKFSQQISGYFDEVYHAKVDQVGSNHQYKLDTKATGLITAKTRLDLPTPIATTHASLKGTLERLQQTKGGAQQTQLTKGA